MKVEGVCHCGGIQYEAEVDPAGVILCHCTDCQTLSGTAFRTVVATKADTFKLLAGMPKSYVKVSESGNRREQTFCPDCGTPIYSAPLGAGTTVVGLRVGALRQRDQLAPKDQFWFRSSVSWLPELPSTKKQEKQPVFSASGSFGKD